MLGKFNRSLVLVVLVIAISGGVGALLGQRTQGASDGDADIRDSLRSFVDVYSVVETNYAVPLDPKKAIYQGAIPGMLRQLDPHSTFFDTKSFSSFHEEEHGKYYGVGMIVGARGNKTVVMAPFSGSPAYRAGIHAGDVIVAIDGKRTENLNTSEVSDLLRGPKGSTVHITLAREGKDDLLQLTVVRDEIPRNSVDLAFQIKPGIGYLHINGFHETTEHEVAAALQHFGDLQGLILDLRGNPGGLLTEAVGVADKFLKKGSVVVSQHGRASAEQVFRARRGNGGKEYPLVVLINQGSASAAEIVAGAIQDHDRGLVVGETSFGKGLVQTVFPLSDDTGLALTTAKYYTPSGRLIQRDYSGLSVFDYYYNRAPENYSNKEVRLTDSGRTVYGGGGITPDEKLETPKSNRAQDTLLQHYAFFNFAKRYLADKHVDKNFEVNDVVLHDFRKFLNDQQLPLSEADLLQSQDWIKTNIKSELFISEFGQEEGIKVRAEWDPLISKAFDFLPKAKELAANAERIIAEKNRAHQLDR